MIRWRSLASVLALCVLASGCAAAIASRTYTPASAQDGIVYRLPETQLVITATYELRSCSAAEIRLVGLSLGSRLAPSDDPADAFVIDPEALHTPLGSVGPARVELRNHMLASVGITTTSDVGALISLAAKTVSILRPGMAVGGAAANDGHCTEAAVTALTRMETAKSTVETLERHLATADAQFRTAPSEDLERLVTRLDAQLAAARAAQTQIRDGQLRRTVQFICTPEVIRTPPPSGEVRPNPAIALACNGRTSPAQASAASLALRPDRSTFAVWLLPTAPNATTALTDAFWEMTAISVQLRATPAPSSGFAALPASGRWSDGVYYRRPVSGSVAVTPSHPNASTLAIDPTPVSLPQLGQLAFLQMRGARIGGRSIAVAFDETGAIRTYEYTSSGAAREVMTAVADSAGQLETDELSDLQREIDLLNRRRELIEAQENLDEALSDDPPTEPTP